MTWHDGIKRMWRGGRKLSLSKSGKAGIYRYVIQPNAVVPIPYVLYQQYEYGKCGHHYLLPVLRSVLGLFIALKISHESTPEG